MTQGSLFDATFDMDVQIANIEVLIYFNITQNNALEAKKIIETVEAKHGLKARWAIVPAIEQMLASGKLKKDDQNILYALLGRLESELRRVELPEAEINKTVDDLLRRSRAYRESSAFKEMMEFVARFRDYAPYNNMLVRTQNPHCRYYATQNDWKNRFNREIVEDARPLIILRPKGPVMLVYDIQETQGDPLSPFHY